MIRLDPKTKQYYLTEDGPEAAQLDLHHDRVEPGALRWHTSPKVVRGLGDVVEVVAAPIAKALGLKSCGCAQRRAALNRRFPWKRGGSS